MVVGRDGAVRRVAVVRSTGSTTLDACVVGGLGRSRFPVLDAEAVATFTVALRWMDTVWTGASGYRIRGARRNPGRLGGWARWR